MKKILVTGSSGFAGSHFVEHIHKTTDWHVIGLDSFRHRGDSERVNHLDASRYEIHTCDLATPISQRLMKKVGSIDYIVNFASESHVDRSIEDPVPFIQNNVNLALSMLEFSRQVRPDKFIQISTDEVFGPAPEGTAHGEWSVIIPSNPYAASKAAQEAIAISYWRTFQVPLIITNTMNLFAERQDKEKFLPMLISRIAKGETVTIHGSPEYIGKRHYIHARNLADALLFLLQNHEPNNYADLTHSVSVPSRFNIVGELELNNLELASIVSEIMGKPLKYDLVDFHRARPGHDRRYALNGDKLIRAGWKMPKSFRESLEQTIHWTLEHPEWL